MSLFDNAIVTKRFRIGFGLLVFAVIGGIVWVVIGAHQPEYQGRDLKSWLYEAKSNDWMSARSETAIRAMGTDALPGLLAMVRVKDSLFRKGLLALSKKQEWIPINFRTREDIQEMAWHGILILGPIARPAIPDLVHDLDDPDPQVRVLAAYCLWEIGSPGQEAVPALIRCLNDALKRNTGSDWDVAQLTWTALALGEMGSASRQAIPQLTALSSLTNASDWFPALSAKAALIKINGESVLPYLEPLKDTSIEPIWQKSTWLIYFLRTNAEPAIPILLQTLQRTNISASIQKRSMELLGGIHEQADTCIPAIKPFLQSTNLSLRQAAAKAIFQFDSEAAAKAGVK